MINQSSAGHLDLEVFVNCVQDHMCECMHTRECAHAKTEIYLSNEYEIGVAGSGGAQYCGCMQCVITSCTQLTKTSGSKHPAFD